MNWQQQCLAVIPCSNEEQGLAALLPELRQHLSHILVVDDGSTDGTQAVARKFGAEVLTLAQNHGKGIALRQGLDRAKQLGYRWALLMDGDGQHSAADIPAFLAQAEHCKPDLLIGNRMTQCANMPFVRHWTNRYLSYRISNLLGLSLPDTQCGFRLIRLEALSGLSLTTTGFEIESEILVQMALAQRRIAFVPITTIYQGEQSKIHPLRDSLRWFRWLHSVKLNHPAPVPPAEVLKPSQA
ncbi:MAG: glycosyltransferase family 2 protein [Verrucomicrobiota bacterium]